MVTWHSSLRAALSSLVLPFLSTQQRKTATRPRPSSPNSRRTRREPEVHGLAVREDLQRRHRPGHGLGDLGAGGLGPRELSEALDMGMGTSRKGQPKHISGG